MRSLRSRPRFDNAGRGLRVGPYAGAVALGLRDGPFTSGTLGFRFTTQPASQIIEADGANTASFSVATAGGVGTVTYQWQLDSGSGFANITDETSASYETGILTTGDDGNEYRCQATDDNETITSSAATLQVYATLAISVQPTNQEAAPEETATFSVTATGGFGTKSYQWQLDSGAGFANISGATSASYETPTLELSDSGNEYRVVVSDQDSNEVTSDAATLTVSSAFSPIDEASVVEVYDAFETDKHTYVAANVVDQYSVTSEVATIQTTAAHNKLVGQSIVVADVAASVNGTFTVASVPTSTTLTYSVPGASDIGNTAVTGSVDWEDRAVSNVLGLRELYNFSFATVSQMPKWDSSAQEMLWTNLANTKLLIPSALADAWLGSERVELSVYRKQASFSTLCGLTGRNLNTGTDAFTLFFRNATQLELIHGGSPSAILWNDASNDNGNTKLGAFYVSADDRRIYVNDMATAKASNATSVTLGTTSGLDYAVGFIAGATSRSIQGSVNVQIFGTSLSALGQTYRENVKAYYEAKGVTFG